MIQQTYLLLVQAFQRLHHRLLWFRALKQEIIRYLKKYLQYLHFVINFDFFVSALKTVCDCVCVLTFHIGIGNLNRPSVSQTLTFLRE